MYTTISAKRKVIESLLGVEKERELYDHLITCVQSQIPYGPQHASSDHVDQIGPVSLSIFDKVFETEYLNNAFQVSCSTIGAREQELRIAEDIKNEDAKLDAIVMLIFYDDETDGTQIASLTNPNPQ